MTKLTRATSTALALAALAGLSISAQAPRQWRDYAGGPDSSRFVAARQITPANVSRLQVAWTYPKGQSDFNPLVVRNVIYTLGANNAFVALDAATGREIWSHPPV
ncbi:MAG: quinoprotein glucose dehydrogenase, partial [Vicinamibacterales bacterium]